MTLDTYKHDLLEAISHAGSTDEVQQLIENAMAALLQNKVHGHIISRFVDKVIYDLEHRDISSIEKNDLSNIETAKNELVLLKKYLVEKTN